MEDTELEAEVGRNVLELLVASTSAHRCRKLCFQTGARTSLPSAGRVQQIDALRGDEPKGRRVIVALDRACIDFNFWEKAKAAAGL